MDLRAFAGHAFARYRDEIVQMCQDLLRIPSQNMPPLGEEQLCQEHIAGYLARHDLPPDVYELTSVPGLADHPDYWPGREYGGRPNVEARLPGRGGGRSLLLTGHVDTVALGEEVWSKPPFGAEIHAGRLYGLGAQDMKAALGAMLVLVKALAELQVELQGTLVFESVVDEEEAGVNGTLAGRLHSGRLDAGLIAESTELKVYPASRGALIMHILFESQGTWIEVGRHAGRRLDAVEQIGVFLSHLGELRAQRRAHPMPALYRSYPDPVPVEVTKIYAGGWGSQVPIAVPHVGRIELIMQTVPGEERGAVLAEFEHWLDGLVERYPEVFLERPQVTFPRRWMHPTELGSAHPLVAALTQSAELAAGGRTEVVGAPYPCDLWALQRTFGIPAVIFGPQGGNAHAADEYVELESLFAFWQALFVFALSWCGVV